MLRQKEGRREGGKLRKSSRRPHLQGPMSFTTRRWLASIAALPLHLPPPTCTSVCSSLTLRGLKSRPKPKPTPVSPQEMLHASPSMHPVVAPVRRSTAYPMEPEGHAECGEVVYFSPSLVLQLCAGLPFCLSLAYLLHMHPSWAASSGQWAVGTPYVAAPPNLFRL
jgi:hypothetical protein